jgi:Mitochondrial carrier protein
VTTLYIGGFFVLRVAMANDAQATHSEQSNEKLSQVDSHEAGPVRRFSTATRGRLLVRQFTQSTTIHNIHTKPIEAASVSNKSIGCGLVAGVMQAALFSPYDRALYLSMTNQTPFLTMQNFRNPFVGLSQSIGGRALSGGLYFPLEQFFFQRFNHTNSAETRDNSMLLCFASGTAAGAVNAMILNPLSAIKYKTWSRLYNRGMLQEAFSMLRQGGRSVFYRGLTSTLLRDVSFGGCYTCIRLQLQWAWSLPHEHQWAANLFAASLATIVSGPFNLARNVQYATKSSQIAPTTLQVLKELSQDACELDGLHQKSAYLLKRLRIGWGTARVATGMAFGHWVYDGLHALVHD